MTTPPTDPLHATVPEKQDERFLRGVVSSATSYSEGWRAVCARLLYVEAALDVLSKAVSHSEQGKLLARAEAQAEQITTLQAENAVLMSAWKDQNEARNDAEAQLREARAQALEDAAVALSGQDWCPQRVYNWIVARADSERKEGAS